jgi:hypothetical protein
MTTPPTASDRPFGPDTDEALSALLDGELGAFASDHGISETEARDRLESWPDLATRRAAFEAARGAVRAPTPALDDVTRRRLVRTASEALPGSSGTTAPRSRSWARTVVVAAAGLVVVAGIGFAVSTMGGDDASMSSGDSAGSASTAGEALRGDVGDLGDVTSPEDLRALLDRREAAARADDSSEQPEDAPAPQSATPSTSAGTEGGAFDRLSSVSPEACARQLAGRREVVFTGTGTYDTVPVTIIGITERGRSIVFVVPSTDCTNVLASISR